MGQAGYLRWCGGSQAMLSGTCPGHMAMLRLSCSPRG
jgi:hypothetical protein